MRILLTTISATLFTFFGYSQVTLTLRPDSLEGKDAVIWYLSDQAGTHGPTNDINYGNERSFLAHEWTWSGSEGTRRSLIDFDLSQIPANATITDAKLSLYAFPQSPDGGHSTLSGSNECRIQQITSTWNEDDVTWNTAPSVTSVNEVVLAASLVDDQDYLDIDVTAMIQEQYANPTANFGFMISMITQENYRAMIFGSSDNLDSTLHPKLVITYDPVNSISENDLDADILVYPNPSSNGQFSIKMEGEYRFKMRNLEGRTVYEQCTSVNGAHDVQVSNLAQGTYFIELNTGENTYVRKLQLN